MSFLCNVHVFGFIICDRVFIYSYMDLPYVLVHSMSLCMHVFCVWLSLYVCVYISRVSHEGEHPALQGLTLTSSDTSLKLLEKTACWQHVYVYVCVVCARVCVWMMDWGHGGLQGCNVVAKTNSCACVWGRCFIATQHIEISQINTPLSTFFA